MPFNCCCCNSLHLEAEGEVGRLLLAEVLPTRLLLFRTLAPLSCSCFRTNGEGGVAFELVEEDCIGALSVLNTLTVVEGTSGRILCSPLAFTELKLLVSLRRV